MRFSAKNVAKNHKALSFAGVVFFVGAIATLFLVRSGVGDLEAQTWDRRLRWLTTYSKPDPRIKIIIIDQVSLDSRARLENQFWPWPRTLYNPILDFLHKSGAKGVAFDMLFTEPSTTSVTDDRKFGEAMKTSLPVVSAMALRASEPISNLVIPEEIKAKQLKSEGESRFFRALIEASNTNYRNAAFPIPEIIAGTRALANVSVPPQSRNDKIFRFASPGGRLNGVPVLDLPFALYDVTHPGSAMADELLPFLESDGRFVVRFHGGAGTYPWYSIDAVIQSWVQLQNGEVPQIPLDTFKDTYVFVGASAGGLFDLRPTPLSGDVPGVEFNATVLDNILNKNFMKRVPVVWAITLMLVYIAVAAASVFFSRLRVQTALALFAICLCLGSALVAARLGWWMPVIVPLVAVVLSTSLSYALQYYFEGRQRQFLRNAFGYYVSPEVIDRIVVDPSALALGGARRDVSIFFSDLVGFSKISEKLDPPVIAGFLNRFLSELTDIILDERGTVDKYEGDAIIAFWNAPIEVAKHESRAVRTALRCQARLKAISGEFERDFGIVTKAGFGIHSGDVVVGNFGSRTRFNYTIIGDAVNLTARLEGVNRVFGSGVIVSEACKVRCEDAFAWRRIGTIRVVGRDEPVTIFEPFMLPLSDETKEFISEFDRARALFDNAQMVEALEIFTKLGPDPVSLAYEQRAQKQLQDGIDGREWSPIWELKAK